VRVAPKEQWWVSQPAAVAQSEAAVAQGDHRPRADLVAARSLEAAEPLMAAPLRRRLRLLLLWRSLRRLRLLPR
jgi:hypothetical protein